MSLILSTGSNLGDKQQFLEEAKRELSQHFELVAASRLYASAAVDYENQPDFLNQVLEFKVPDLNPQEVLSICLNIEKTKGRKRDINKGPRTLDIDILFWDTQKINDEGLFIPHPRLFERSFIVEPLSELPYFAVLKKFFNFPKSFSNSCHAIN